MRRREVFILLGGAVAWPLAVHSHADAADMPVIGFLSSRSPGESSGVVAAFRQGLGETGFVEGQNLAIAFRWAEGRYDRLPALAAELVGLRVKVLFAAGGPPSAVAAKAATTTIPIVFSAVNQPVELGLIASLNRPGGNLTGMGIFTAALAEKNVGLLKEMVPTAAVVAYLVNPTTPSAKMYSDPVMATASALGITVRVVDASTEQELDNAFASSKMFGADGLVVIGEPFFESQRERIVALAERYALPAIYTFREYVTAGGLMSYGPNLPDSYRRGGMYVGRILKGENVVEATEAEAAARALGLEVAKLEIRRAEDIAPALEAIKAHADALYVGPGGALVNANRVRIHTLSLSAQLPTVYRLRGFVEAGGLMSYGANVADLFRRAAEIVDKILRGTKPVDIPVEQPTKFELVINLTTAKAFGIEIPPLLLARADEVIE
jgi:putative ABC transport system substrate-binding protein